MVDTYAVAGGPLAVEGLFRRRCYFFQAVVGDVCLRQVKLRAVKFALRQVMFAFGESIPPAKLRTKEFRPPPLSFWFFFFLVKEKEHRLPRLPRLPVPLIPGRRIWPRSRPRPCGRRGDPRDRPSRAEHRGRSRDIFPRRRPDNFRRSSPRARIYPPFRG